MNDIDARLIADYITWLTLAGRSEKTAVARQRLLRILADDLPYGLAYVHEDELAEWWAAHCKALRRGKRWGKQTRSNYRSHIAGFYGWAVAAQRLTANPSHVIPAVSVPRRKPRPAQDRALRLILKSAKEPYPTWAALAAYCGLRCCEIARLDRDDIDEEGLWLSGKGDKEGWVPMHPEAWKRVKDLPPGPVARRRDGTRTTAANVSNQFRDFTAALGVPEVTLHKLRHWCGTNLLRQTGNIRHAQRVLRHASIATTAGYTDVLDEELTAAVALLPSLT